MTRQEWHEEAKEWERRATMASGLGDMSLVKLYRAKAQACRDIATQDTSKQITR